MYQEIDDEIINAIANRRNPIYAKGVVDLAEVFAVEQGRPAYRVIDQRLQALRKAGVIQFLTKKQSYLDGGHHGWNVVGVKKQ